MPLPMSDEVEDLRFAATPADIEALHQARTHRPVATADYERFLMQFTVTVEEQRRKPGPRGQPFRL